MTIAEFSVNQIIRFKEFNLTFYYNVTFYGVPVGFIYQLV